MERDDERGFEIEDPEQIRLLGSPIRNDILAFLDGEGPSTVVEIARGLGRAADTLYYHLARLEDGGVVVRGESSDDEGAVWDVPGRPITLRYRPKEPANVAAIVDAVGTTLRSARRGFAGALERGGVELSGPTRNVWASHARGRLTEAELGEVNDAIERIFEIFREARGPGEGRMHEVTLVLAPLPEEPADRRQG